MSTGKMRTQCGHTNQWLWSSHRNKRKQIPNVMPQDWQLIWWARWSPSSSARGLALGGVPRADAEFLIWHRMLTDDSTASVWSWHLQEPSGPDVVHASSRPFTPLSASPVSSWCRLPWFPTAPSITLPSHHRMFVPLNCQLAIQVGDPKQRPLACPRSVTSASLARGVQF